MYDLILASASPRRRQLLEKAGFDFSVHTVKVSENIEENLNSRDAVEDISKRKALAFLEQHKLLNLKGKIVVTGDTMVCREQELLGKPRNPEQAVEFLRSLSGGTHSVITALSLVIDGSSEGIKTLVTETLVEFHELTEGQIQDYIATGEPMDKAGAYAIQGGGKEFVKSTTGSWSNVVGLPVEELENWLKELGYEVRRRQS
ncbi:MAG: septum formation protein Maf [Bdellovibrionales bacterium]|nr:septum formation protein Maf [Bdellovibrionales bacterium]